MASKLVAYGAAAFIVLGVAWVLRVNSQLKGMPSEVLKVSPHRWTDEEIKAAYARVRAQGRIDWSKHLPPKLDRRYVVVGGCGGVGGQIVLHLLERGQPPQSIRVVDFKSPSRADMMTGAAAEVDFAQADITSPEKTRAAFNKPWHPSVAELPLTVFHTAALISPADRTMWTYDTIKRVNVDGTQNVVDAAKAAAASVFIATSSSSLASVPVKYWGNPFRRFPKNFWQLIDESDFDRPLKPYNMFFGNYGYSKAIAERIVTDANSPAFRTGSIRPGNAIYGSSVGDQVVGVCLRKGTFPSWMPNIVQNFVHGGHVSLAHLLFEAALLHGSDEGKLPKCAGRPFVVTDAGAPPSFGDMYRLVQITAETPEIRVQYLQPGVMLAIAQIVELVEIASYMPILKYIFPRPRGDIVMLKPGVFTAGSHHINVDAAAQRGIEDGGIDYKHVLDSLHGICQQVHDWNVEQAAMGPKSNAARSSTSKLGLVQEVKDAGAMSAAVSG